MRLGFGLPVSGSWATVDAMAEVAQRADDLGYASLWTFQRVIAPAQGARSWGEMYRAVHDPVVPLAYVAALTRQARLGVAVLNAPYYPPVLLAKQLATLDVVSRGRLDVGLGLGWAEEEFASVSAPFDHRGARTEELVACMDAVWTQDPVGFSGRFTSIPTSSVQPKPVQRPRPPVLLGGAAPRALQRVGRVADGWISASRHDLRRIGNDIDVVRAAAQEAGRDADALRFVVRGVLALDEELRDREGRRRPLSGTEQEIREDLDALRVAGVTEVFLDLNFNPQVGSPDADPSSSLALARTALETFAPG